MILTRTLPQGYCVHHMKDLHPKRLQVFGSLLGGAVGDALGGPVEFMRMDQIQKVFGPAGVTGYPTRSGHSAAFTDDTQMTLWTAEGLMRARQRQRKSSGEDWDPVRAVNGSYLRWFLTQKAGVPSVGSASEGEPLHSGWLIDEPGLWARIAPGNTCLSAMRVGGLGARDDPINDSKGCGGVMRVAPVGLLQLDGADAYQLACDLAALTHGHPAGYVTAGALALILNRLIRGDRLESAVTAALDAVDQEEPRAKICADALRRALSLAVSEKPSYRMVERLGAGWVAEEALAIAVYCALVADDFRDGVLLAVNHSGDSDSTGSIAGQLLGAMLGVDSIPSNWKDGLGLYSVVERVAGDLHDAFYEDRVFPAEEYPRW